MPCPLPYQLPLAVDWGSPALGDFEHVGLLRRGVGVAEVVAGCPVGGNLAYLALPHDCEGGLVGTRGLSASVRAARWCRDLLSVGVVALSPAVQLYEVLNADSENLLPADLVEGRSVHRAMRLASNVVVVPMVAGWRDCPMIWGDVREALAINTPVFLLSCGVAQWV